MLKLIRSYFNLRLISKNRSEKQDLDYLLSQGAHLKNLFERLDWLSRIIVWIRTPAQIEGLRSQFSEIEVISLRAKYFIQVLNRNENWRTQFYKNLAIIIDETDIFDLLVENQFSMANSFVKDFWQRTRNKIIPQPQFDKNLIRYFTNLFLIPSDADWILQLDEKIIEEIIIQSRSLHPNIFDHYREQFLTAMVYVSTQIQSLGLQPEMRERLSASTHLLEMSFFKIQSFVESYVYSTNQTEQDQFKNLCISLISRCRSDVEEVFQHMNSHGVSLDLVLMTRKIQCHLDRLELLLAIDQNESGKNVLILKLISNLIKESHERSSLLALFSQTTQLLSQKITERNAQTGEHYIAKDNAEYFKILKAAMGGGALTSVTVVVKTLTGALKIVGFVEGFLFSLNYSLSFLTIHFLHFTLATKQPAMTAPALALKLKQTRAKSEFTPMVDEVVKLVRSQFAGIFGNLLFVIPFTLFFAWLSDVIFGSLLFSRAYSIKSFEAHLLYGPSLLFAAFTGVLLWFSGVVTGWADNWYHFNQITKAVRQNRVFYLSLGDEGTAKLTNFFERNFASLIGNISLGFLLGLVPAILQFLGLPIEVRHVTLATGTLAASLYTLGWDFVSQPMFWWAVGGVISIGLMNLSVSFALAFSTAIRATRVSGRQRYMLLKHLQKRLIQRPLSFVLPMKD